MLIRGTTILISWNYRRDYFWAKQNQGRDHIFLQEAVYRNWRLETLWKHQQSSNHHKSWKGDFARRFWGSFWVSEVLCYSQSTLPWWFYNGILFKVLGGYWTRYNGGFSQLSFKWDFWKNFNATYIALIPIRDKMPSRQTGELTLVPKKNSPTILEIRCQVSMWLNADVINVWTRPLVKLSTEI